MRARLGIFATALGLAALSAPPGTAQPVGNAHLVGGFTQLFVSPCGEPYRGRPGEPYPVVLWFKQADLNHDGVIDLAEFRADHAGFFDALDADGNGYLDNTELAFYEHKVVPDVLGHDRVGFLDPLPGEMLLAESLPDRDGAQLILVQGTGTPHGEQGPVPGQEGVHGPVGGLNAHRKGPRVWEGESAYGLLAEPEPVAAADTNLDGKITKAEFLAAADRRFKLLDKKGDGKLTLDELPMTASQAAASGVKVK